MNRRQLQNKADKIASNNGYTIEIDMKKAGNLKMVLRNLIDDMQEGDFTGNSAVTLKAVDESTPQCKECGEYYSSGHTCQQMVDKAKALR